MPICTRLFKVRRREDRIVRFSLLAAFLVVVGLGIVLAQQSNVAIRESTPDATKIAVIEERMRGLEAAITLQAAKYEDRLQALNHSHEKQVADQSTYLSKDVYQANHKELEGKVATLEQRLTVIESRAVGSSVFRDTSIQNIGIAIAIAGLVFMWVTRLRRGKANGSSR